MIRSIALVASLLALVATAAAAPPSPVELEARAASLRDKYSKDGFTVLVEGPFVVVGDDAPARVKKHATGILRWAIDKLETDFFDARPGKVIEIWLFRNERTYRRGARKYFGDRPSTPYGYYSSEDDAIVMNIGPGAGTLTHEIVHPFIEADFPGAPSWLNEGLASLYERPSDRGGRIVGLPNWRLPNLKRQIRNGTLPSIHKLVGSSADEFYDAPYDSYAFSRYLMLYLQEQGKLVTFYSQFRAARGKDPTGRATLSAVLGTDDLAAFQKKWARWVLALEL